MAADSGNAPSWLFSFVDLAFLMLIAMTQLASDSLDAPELGEVVIPRIGESSSEEAAGAVARSWQLRIHPPSDEAPFELVSPGAAAARIDLEALRQRLAGLKAESVAKPVLAPHEDSRSQDLLHAATALESEWPSRRRALVSRILEAR